MQFFLPPQHTETHTGTHTQTHAGPQTGCFSCTRLECHQSPIYSCGGCSRLSIFPSDTWCRVRLHRCSCCCYFCCCSRACNSFFSFLGVLPGLFRRQRGAGRCRRALGRFMRHLLPLGCSGLGQVTSNPTTLMFAWWVLFIRFCRAWQHGREHVVLGAFTERHQSFHSCSHTCTDMLAGFVSCFRKPTHSLSASPTSLSVPGLGTGGICQWPCHLLAAWQVVVAGTSTFFYCN